MKDFTFDAYRQYLEALRNSIGSFYRFDEFLIKEHQPEQFCLIRHDVDRKARNALKMAQLEHEMGIPATYYFRTKRHTFKPDLIRQIHDMGHEIGYHYESLSDAKGNMQQALDDFGQNLEKLRSIVPVSTCAMHGRPFSPFDNRDLWKSDEIHQKLIDEFNLLGEVYLDIDYFDILYVSDTGRNWLTDKNNLRDTVTSSATTEFHSGEDLINYLNSGSHPRLLFQIHPERWSYHAMDHFYNLAFDTTANTGKRIINALR